MCYSGEKEVVEGSLHNAAVVVSFTAALLLFTVPVTGTSTVADPVN